MNSELDDQQLSAFLDGELEPEEALRVREALRRSPALRARLEALRRVDEGLRALASASPAPSPALRESMRARLTAERARELAPLRRTSRRRRRRRFAGVAAAALAAGLVLWALPRLRPAPEDRPPLEVARRASDLPPAPEAPPAAAPGTPPPGGSETLAVAPEPEAPGTAAPDPGTLAAAPAAPEASRAPVPPPSSVPLPAPPAPAAAEPPGAVALALGSEEVEDLPVIEVLDWLEALDELERSGRG